MTGKRKICDAEKNWYYRESIKKCYKCEKCVIGEGKIKFKDARLPMHPEFGATQCIPCRRCNPGTYNNKRAFRCKHCRDCKQQGRYELRPCTHLQNAVCGDKITSGSTQKYNISNTVTPLESRLSEPSEPMSDPSIAIAVFTLLVFVVLVAVLLAVLYRRKRKGCKMRWQNSSNNRNQEDQHTEYPLMVLKQKDLPCNNRNQQQRAPLPKKSNLRRISENNESSHRRDTNLDSEETTLKTTGSPPNSTGNQNRIQNLSNLKRKNDQQTTRFHSNLNNQSERFYGEVNIACKENSSSSDNSTIQTNRAKPEVHNKLRPDIHHAYVSGSILPIRSLSGFSYSFKAPPLDCMEDGLHEKHLSALHLSATI